MTWVQTWNTVWPAAIIAMGALLLGIIVGVLLSRLWLKDTAMLAAQLVEMHKLNKCYQERLKKLEK